MTPLVDGQPGHSFCAKPSGLQIPSLKPAWMPRLLSYFACVFAHFSPPFQRASGGRHWQCQRNWLIRAAQSS
jgi:hypothetical protein